MNLGKIPYNKEIHESSLLNKTEYKIEPIGPRVKSIKLSGNFLYSLR